MLDRAYEDKLFRTHKFAGAFRYNTQKNCAALLCRALCRVAHMCSRTVSDTANMSRHGSTLCSPTEEKILCRSLFRSGHMSAICARPSQKEVGVKRVETLVSTLLCPCRAGKTRSPRRRKTLRPLGRTRLRSSRTPLSRCRNGLCPPLKHKKKEPLRVPF